MTAHCQTSISKLPDRSMRKRFPGGITVVALYSVTAAGPGSVVLAAGYRESEWRRRVFRVQTKPQIETRTQRAISGEIVPLHATTVGAGIVKLGPSPPSNLNCVLEGGGCDQRSPRVFPLQQRSSYEIRIPR